MFSSSIDLPTDIVLNGDNPFILDFKLVFFMLGIKNFPSSIGKFSCDFSIVF